MEKPKKKISSIVAEPFLVSRDTVKDRKKT
jgi:hypothetical protein